MQYVSYRSRYRSPAASTNFAAKPGGIVAEATAHFSFFISWRLRDLQDFGLEMVFKVRFCGFVSQNNAHVEVIYARMR